MIIYIYIIHLYIFVHHAVISVETEEEEHRTQQLLLGFVPPQTDRWFLALRPQELHGAQRQNFMKNYDAELKPIECQSSAM